MKPAKITPREAQVLDLYCEGIGLKQVARRLGISFKTAESHMYHASVKTGLNWPVLTARWLRQKVMREIRATQAAAGSRGAAK